ncbi:dihydrofolate reductase family protein [Glycomyces paridis]|uniref:Deaminase n=1 Tax=Glycomyces paridis TaxID=2126555 RepID=A0A4S8PJ65_9ACTN|nr:dihydrofolate reductase family protein [Glycomyces paridis]THV28449.1 deaminase [Glycomyces paridis]
MATTLSADLFISVDGWAGSDGLPGYFGYFGPDLGAWTEAEGALPQRVVMGRRTYEAFAALPAAAWGDTYESTMALDKTVVSTTLTEVPWPNTAIAADLVADVAAMKADGGAPIRTWGSLSLVGQLLGAGLVDRLRVLTFPLFAGDAGRDRAFADVAAADLELVDHRVLDGRIVLAEYRPTGKDIPRG